ncbi:MAG: hypothetical protein ACTSU5_11930 [Promethearchaeota archaeon]
MSELSKYLKLDHDRQDELYAQIIEILVTSFDSAFGSLDQLIVDVNKNLDDRLDGFQRSMRDYLHALGGYIGATMQQSLHNIYDRLQKIEDRLVSVHAEDRPPRPVERERPQVPRLENFRPPPVPELPKKPEIHVRENPITVRADVIRELKAIFEEREKREKMRAEREAAKREGKQ